jgi:Ankyrin repeats (many copies)/Ankyrin repeat
MTSLKRGQLMLGSVLPQVCTCSGLGSKCPHGTAEHTAITPQDPNLARVFAKSLGTPVIAPIDTNFFHRVHSAIRLGAVETLRPLLTHYKYELDMLTREQKISLLWDALHGPFTVLPRKECKCCKPNQVKPNTALGAVDHLNCLRLLLTATPLFNQLAREFNARQSLIVTGASWLVKHQLSSDLPILPSMLRKLDQAGINVVDAGTEDKEPPLHWAAKAGSFGSVAYLVKEKGVPVDLITETTPDPPLYHAYKFGHPQAFAELLKLGAKMTWINPKNGYGWAVVHGMAICRPWLGKPQEQMWEMGVAHDPSIVTARDMKGRTALHRAAAAGNTPAIEVLVSLGWEIGAEDDEGWTPLCCAINSGRLAPVKALCDLGALQKVHCSQQALHRVTGLAVLAGVHAHSQACIDQHYYYYPDMSTGEERPVNKFNWRGAYYEPCQENIAIIQALFDTTPSLRCMVSSDGRSVGCLALSLRLTDGSPGLLDTHAAALLRLFHRNGCNVLTRGPADEGTALHAAAARGYCKTIEFLIKEAGADPNALSTADPTDCTGVPPVYPAVLHNKPKAALRIMDLGGTSNGRRTDLTRWAIVRAAIYDSKLTVFARLSIMDSDPLARRDASTGMSCLDACVYVSNVPVLKCILVGLRPPGITVTFQQALDDVHPLAIWSPTADNEQEGTDEGTGEGSTTPAPILANPLHIAFEEHHWECALMLLEAGSSVRFRGGPKNLSADGYIPELETELSYLKREASRALGLADAAEADSKAEKVELEQDWIKLLAERARIKAEKERAAAAILAAAQKAAEAERRKKRMLDVRRSRSPSPSSPVSPSSPTGSGSPNRGTSPLGSPKKGTSPLGSPARPSSPSQNAARSPSRSPSPSPPGSPTMKGRSRSSSSGSASASGATAITPIDLPPIHIESVPILPLPRKSSPAPRTSPGAGGGKLTKNQALQAAKEQADSMSQEEIEFQRAVKARAERMRKGMDVVEDEEMRLIRRRDKKRRKREREKGAGSSAPGDVSADDDDDDGVGAGGEDSDSDDDDEEEPKPEDSLVAGVSAAGRIFRMPTGAGGGREKTPEEIRAIAEKRAERKLKKEHEAFLLGPKTKEYLRLRSASDTLAKEVAILERIIYLINKKADEHAADWQNQMIKAYRRATRADRWGTQAPGPRTVFPDPPHLRRYEGTTARDWFYEFYGEEGIRRLQQDGYVEDGFMDCWMERVPTAPPAEGDEEEDEEHGYTYQPQRGVSNNGSRFPSSPSAVGFGLAPIHEHARHHLSKVDDTDDYDPYNKDDVEARTPGGTKVIRTATLAIGGSNDALDAVDDLLKVGVTAAKAKTTAPVLPVPGYYSAEDITTIRKLPSGHVSGSPTKAAAQSILQQNNPSAANHNHGGAAARAGAGAASPEKGGGGGRNKEGFVKRIASAFSFRRVL